MIRCLFIAYLSVSLSVFGSDPPAELLQYKEEVNFDGRKVVTIYFHEIQINDPSGDVYGEIQIPYSDIYSLTGVKAVLTDATGREIRKVKRKEMTDKSAISSFSFYENDFVREFRLKHNSYPYRIRYTYTISNKQYITLADWFPVIDPSIPTRSSTLRITVPATEEITYHSQFVEPPKVEEDDQTRTYSWSAGFKGKLERELHIPHVMKLIPRVTVMPDHFYFDQPGNLETWKNFGNWICDLNKGLDRLTPQEEAKIEMYTSQVTNKLERLKILYNRLQEETRYVNISIETGGFKPYPASYVSEKKYGDCKALSNYFRAVLRHAGIKAYYALVYLGKNKLPIDTTYIYPQFNHVILMVPMDSDTIWVDCTSKSPLGYNSPSLQNRKVLVVDRDNSRFKCTPELRIQDVVQSRNATFSMLMNNNVRGDFMTTYRGSLFLYLHDKQRNLPPKEFDKIIRTEFTANGFDPLKYTLVSTHKDSSTIALQVEAVSAKYYKKYGDDLVFSVLPLQIPRFEKPANRSQDVWINYPIAGRDTFEYMIPPGAVFESAPDPIVFESPYGCYRKKIQVLEDRILIMKEFSVKSAKVPIDEYEAFYAFVNKCITSENSNHIVFTNH